MLSTYRMPASPGEEKGRTDARNGARCGSCSRNPANQTWTLKASFLSAYPMMDLPKQACYEIALGVRWLDQSVS